MRLTTNRADLAATLAWVTSAVPRNPQSPVLGGVRLTVDGGTLHLAAFDYDTAHTARVQIDQDTSEDGETLVAGHFLREIVAAIKGATVELEVDGARLNITAGRSAYRAATMPLEDYPHLPTMPPIVGHVPHDELARIVGTVEHAASRDPSLGVLTAVHLFGSQSPATLTATCTDKFRIARALTAWELGGDFDLSAEAMVPARALVTAVKGMSGTVSIGYHDGMIGFADEHRSVTMRTLPIEQWPASIGRVIDSVAGDLTLTVDAEQLAEAVKRAALVSGADHRIVRLQITAASSHSGDDSGEIAITAESDANDAAEVVPCSTNDSIDILFGGTALADALLCTGARQVTIAFGANPHKAVLITPTTETADAVAVVMPRKAI